MCGIFAAFTASEFPASESKLVLDALARRGPDAEGYLVVPGVSMGHRRLAILDLDDRASQPMESTCGRYLIVFNGEIYNFRELRQGLQEKGYCFRTDSDTEVILNLYIEYGESMLPKLMGMFAIIIWDRHNLSGFVARDPYGIKPLYYAVLSDGVVFASQVKALLPIDNVSKKINLLSRAFFWMLGSIPEPLTWYSDIKMMPAGSFAYINDSKVGVAKSWCNIGCAWSGVKQNSPKLKYQEIFPKVRAALLESISRHMVSDVPIAVLLSGGIDSGAVIALMRELDPHREIIGITVVYDEYKNTPLDETDPAKEIADLYNVKHRIVRVSEEDFISDLPQIMDAMDQPSVDGINTWYATKAVADIGVKVVLSGVGGDELFLGYPSFRLLPKLIVFFKIIGYFLPLKNLMQALLKRKAIRSGNNRWRNMLSWIATIQGAWWLRRSILTPKDAFHIIGSRLDKSFSVVKAVDRMVGVLPKNNIMSLAQIESMTYLRNQLLRDADWASMYHGVELRTPLVDSHLLFTLQPYLPYFARYKNKILLAKAPQNSLPNSIIFRKKTGFGIPVIQWINNVYKNKKLDKFLLMKHIENSFINSTQ